ncbi:hypothetical protein C5167_008037 [Papaver somniferum]|uniref:Protein kinase domain-containing protein n=1 Tax=Papaver somniferum TaxID=3469 RepID=A0A4Y7JUU9_PAPSO|nr:serine/threonine-protein kinase PEPKR2-like [Papaver somniferum]XP_026391053.1 serine/threonine-protein kinase PEPKR2-like [Papaver somniferum]RZC64346.1 hypothetical protein C5167_008037 [Papaver somniferum]
MEMLTKKRKGIEPRDESSFEIPEILSRTRKSPASLSIAGSHFSLEDCSRSKKKYKEGLDTTRTDVGGEGKKSRLPGVATAPASGSSISDSHGRGHKRKIGCIESGMKLRRKKKIEQEYVLGKEIGLGKYGCVRLCKSKIDGGDFACKTLKKGEETVHREVEIMQHLSGHPGVVALTAVYEDTESFHLLMELCSGGRLLDQMVRERQYSEQRAANVLKELMLVVKYCHEMGVVHRDIKPENILLTTAGKMKLADFGLAMRVSHGQTLSGVVGSPAYVAPEVLVGNYSEKVDIWSAGVLLHALLIGVLPFKGESLEKVFEAIKKVELDFETGVWESISRPARDLIGRMLTRDVDARLTADQVLRHPWIIFYTERTLKTLSIKSKLRAGKPSNGVLEPQDSLERARLTINALCLNSDSNTRNHVSSASVDSSSDQKSEEQDECGLVDALAVAISRVSLSEPKRSRLCGPNHPIMKQECSSNMQSNNLCKAF